MKFKGSTYQCDEMQLGAVVLMGAGLPKALNTHTTRTRMSLIGDLTHRHLSRSPDCALQRPGRRLLGFRGPQYRFPNNIFDTSALTQSYVFLPLESDKNRGYIFHNSTVSYARTHIAACLRVCWCSVWKSSQSTAFCADFVRAGREDARINGNGSLVAEGQKINSQCWNERIQNQWHCCNALKGMNGFWLRDNSKKSRREVLFSHLSHFDSNFNVRRSLRSV